ncbi:hypothetical protein Acr_17g0003270 [Actinidia rufa]|uniref:Uncharacterized protein n=1 Tax=Actinidia rufa TaxID=165716 RepID=A0A7J0G1U6_9ERIC|nr:hypothetical protein Acr_17g0003270 [Actinidia rufa]
MAELIQPPILDNGGGGSVSSFSASDSFEEGRNMGFGLTTWAGSLGLTTWAGSNNLPSSPLEGNLISSSYPSRQLLIQLSCALLPLIGVRCKVRRFASRRDSISPPLCAQLERSPPLILSERDLFRRRRACRCASTLSLSSELLHGHPAVVAHFSCTPALALRASVQQFLLLSIHLANTTGPMSDNSSPVWTFSPQSV